jgi:hypothetical protein
VVGIDVNNLSFASLAIDPNNPDVLYAGNRFLSSILPRKMYKTVNATTQCTWSEVYSTSAEISISDIRVSPHSSSTIYVATGLFENGIGVLKSENGGSSWTPYASGILMKKLRAVEIDPLSSSLVYSGGTGAHYKSFDAGATWQEKNTGLLFPIGTALTKAVRIFSQLAMAFSSEVKTTAPRGKSCSTNYSCSPIRRRWHLIRTPT